MAQLGICMHCNSPINKQMDCIYVPPFRSKITPYHTQSHTDGKDDLTGCNLLIQRWPLHCKSCSLWDNKFLVLSVMQGTSYIKKKIVCNCITKKCFFLVFEKKNQDDSVMPSPTHSRYMPTFPDLLSVGSALFPWFLSLFALSVCYNSLHHSSVFSPNRQPQERLWPLAV